AQKAGNVPQGRRLAAALLKGAERLALEVDDISIRLRDENLTEMEVSVDTDRQAAPAVLGESRQARHEIGFARENGIGERLALGTERLPCALEVGHAAFDLFSRV